MEVAPTPIPLEEIIFKSSNDYIFIYLIDIFKYIYLYYFI